MSVARHHADWLNLLEVSGPFLSVGVLSEVFPQELDSHDPQAYARLKLAYDEWLEGRNQAEVHHAWIDFVLSETLDLGEVLKRGQEIPSGLEARVEVHGETLRPSAVVQRVNGSSSRPRLLVAEYPCHQKLTGSLSGNRWSASPATRMMELLLRTEQGLGLVTNGEEWMVVHAKGGETTGFGSWYSELLTEERVALRSFRTLLGRDRFFGVPDPETLQGLLERSREDQKEVTDQLGRQVRRAVESLIFAIDWVDRTQNRKLLAGYDEKLLYEAALTVMMRLVFLLCAEERGLLLLGKSDLYDQHYAVSPLRDQLRARADQYGEEVLQSRYDAWSRLLSIFRAVHSGIAHEELSLPAYGGSLFDPDRFPFLEGRPPSSSWKSESATPLPIDNRTVLELLEALQLLEVRVGKGRGYEAQRLSFRALDIEQIGHVYEGLLDHTAVRAEEPVLGLEGAKGLEPEVPLYELELQRQKGESELLQFLKTTTGRNPNTLEKTLGLYQQVEAPKLPLACDNDSALVQRVKPYVGLVRENSRGVPLVFTKGSVYVTQGSDRRATGTHYTPRSLTEEIVQHTLDPLVYEGMADGVEPSPETLKSASEILDLKVCDLAMGSGAFLVQACRYLSEKVVEAWESEASAAAQAAPGAIPISTHREEQLALARRLVVEKCLYGVDKNPLAVEMAKLSLWLITLDRQKPFSFLDHALRCGDSLLGVTDRRQLHAFNLQPNLQELPVFGDQLLEALQEAERIRQELRSFTVQDPRDGERKRFLLARAEELTERLKAVADLLIAAYLASGGKPKPEHLDDQVALIQHALGGEDWRPLQRRAQDLLDQNKPQGTPSRRPFHWALEFPEVFGEGRAGFDAIVGNPPFQGGTFITGTYGTDYREFLVNLVASSKRGNADLCAFFLLRAAGLIRAQSTLGYLTTNTISEGDTREVGLDQLVEWGFSILRAVPSRKWPGEANLEVAHLWLYRGAWKYTSILDDKQVSSITTYLTKPGRVTGKPLRLIANADLSYSGSKVYGSGFVLDIEKVNGLLERSPKSGDVLYPYLNGKDLNSDPEQRPSRWVINFFDWPLEKAQSYPECFEIIRALVKPERELLKLGDPARRLWWHYERPRLELYSAISDFNFFWAIARVSKYLTIDKTFPNFVLSDQVVAIANSRLSVFALLQSSFHEAWTLVHSSSLRTDLRYTPSDCFETFPFPQEMASLEAIGEDYHQHRARIMLERQEGLTKTYNRFHDSAETSEDISTLRELHQQMDQQVAATYGWSDLDLGHDFHETKQGLRYTLSDPARQEVLDRLLALNHQRYAQEVAQGLHAKKKPKTKKTTKAKTKKTQALGQGELF